MLIELLSLLSYSVPFREARASSVTPVRGRVWWRLASGPCGRLGGVFPRLCNVCSKSFTHAALGGGGRAFSLMWVDSHQSFHTRTEIYPSLSIDFLK